MFYFIHSASSFQIKHSKWSTVLQESVCKEGTACRQCQVCTPCSSHILRPTAHQWRRVLEGTGMVKLASGTISSRPGELYWNVSRQFSPNTELEQWIYDTINSRLNRMHVKMFKCMLHKYLWETDTKVLMLFFFFLHHIFRTTVFLQLIMVSPTDWRVIGLFQSIFLVLTKISSLKNERFLEKYTQYLVQ